MEPPDAPATGTASVAEVTIRNPQGMHLRPATAFARIAMDSGCDVRVETDSGSADGSSVLELAMLAASHGTRAVIVVEGEGREATLAALVQLVNDGFEG